MQEDIRETLVAAAEGLLRAGKKPDSLTTREIAAAAGVSVGLINYHFGSKGDLIAKAIDRIFADFMPRWDRVAKAAAEARAKAERDGRPMEAAHDALCAGKDELKALLRDMAAYSAEFSENGNDFGVKRQLMEGEFDNARFIAPVLRTILPPGTDEREVRWAAYFIVVPLQVVFLRHSFLTEWTGTNLEDRAERDKIIDSVVDRVLEPFAGKPGADSSNTR